MDNLLERLRNNFSENYSVDRELKAGGMSRLFLATDVALSRRVVIKILPPELTSDMMAARFKRESEVTAHLQHPNILPIITAGLKDGLMYYVMPYISGESLRERLQRDHQLPVRDAVNITSEIASALAYAHRQNVIHRDIKPENILLQDGHAILADFGIASALSPPGESPHSRITRTGMSIGTVGYMAPEQSLGGTDVDSRADVYSLGVVAHEMLAGEPPFMGATTQAVLAAHLTKPPPRLDKLRDDVPIPVCRAIEKALRKDPAERFQTASEFSEALGGPAPRMSRITRGVMVRKLRRVSRKKIATGIALAAVAGGGAVYTYYRAPKGPDETVSVVVAPFDAGTRDLGLWHEGIVDLLARNMDGAGTLHTVSPTVTIRAWDPRARSNHEAAYALGRSTKSQYAIYGTLVPSAGDSIHMHYGVVDVKSDSVLLEQDLNDPRVEKLASSLTVNVLHLLRDRHRLGAVRATSAIGSDSALAIKAFLQGEQFYRRTSWDSAAASYLKASEIDSGFAVALRRVAQVNAWQKNESDSLTRAYAMRAGARNHNLAPRDSLLILADSLSSALENGDVNQPDWRLSRRLFATVNEAAARYPDDPEVWYVVGEARYHHGYGSIFDISEEDVRTAFRHATALDSAFSPAYIHLVALGYTLDGADGGRAAGRNYLARNPGGAHADAVRLLDALADPARSRTNETDRLLLSTPSATLLDAWELARRWPDSTESALRLLRAIARHPRTSPTYVQDTLALMNDLPLQLAFDGRLREAYLALGNRPSRLLAQLALLGGVDPDTASAVFSGWLAKGVPQVHSALAWWAERSDTTSIRGLESFYRSALARAKPDEKPRANYNIKAAHAYLLLARRDTTGARGAFAALSDTSCLRCDLDHLVAARLLASDGKTADADRILRQRLFSAISPTEIVMALDRGALAQKSRIPALARRCYQVVVGAWARGDPEVQGRVRQARQGLAAVSSGGA